MTSKEILLKEVLSKEPKYSLTSLEKLQNHYTYHTDYGKIMKKNVCSCFNGMYFPLLRGYM
ncbi:hypothetical protein J2Z66_004671 [Paenibacillus eucommiae]|uniref:Uncharacterized protein n=1 Tax=Paenibacillus eucommiae TaxID=1355755 RepID=A0ABS4IZP6_9BACL|nr:hypothetical protein [Paenibacillus eucommiae]